MELGRVAELAARQWGAIALDQALHCGLTVDQVRGLHERGMWIHVTRCVYRVAGAPVTWQQAVMVACLAGPPGTVASYLTAAALFSLVPPPPLPHVTVPRGTSGRLRIARVHYSNLSSEDVSRIGPIPVTRPARTIVDAATLLSGRQLDDLVDDVLCRALATAGSIREALARARPRGGRKGDRELLRSLAVWTDGALPGSPAEMRLLRRIVGWGFPHPVRQHEVRTADDRFVGKPDFAWIEWKVGVEYDGKRHHGPRELAADEAREQRFEAIGWRLVRADRFDLRPSSVRLRDELAKYVPRTSSPHHVPR